MYKLSVTEIRLRIITITKKIVQILEDVLCYSIHSTLFIICRVNIRLCGWVRKDTSTLAVRLVSICLCTLYSHHPKGPFKCYTSNTDFSGNSTPPRNAINVEPYIFVMLFSVKSDTLPPHTVLHNTWMAPNSKQCVNQHDNLFLQRYHIINRHGSMLFLNQHHTMLFFINVESCYF